MRIVLFCLSDHFTFQETALNLKKNIEAKTKNEVLVITSNQKTYDEGTQENVFRINYKYKSMNIFHHYLRVRKINEIIKKFQPTHIVFINPHPINLYFSKKYRKKANIYNIIHDVIPHGGDKNEALVKLYNKRISKVSDFIIVHSEIFVELFGSEYKFPKEKVLYTKLWREYKEYAEINESGECLFFGRINPYKGMKNLYEIAKKCPTIKFNIVGRWDKTMENDRENLLTLDNVIINDSIVTFEDMEDYFNRAELVIIPYESGTQSGVIIDTYKYSRPVIAFNVGGIGEQVIHGKTGYLVEQANIDEFSKLLKEYMQSSKEHKTKMSLSSWSYGIDEYSTQKGYIRLLDILEKGRK